jgi:hypothetical protein
METFMDQLTPQDPSPLLLDEDCRGPSFSLLGELWLFVRVTGKWWLVPVLIALLLLGAAAMLSGTAYAPFLYTLF